MSNITEVRPIRNIFHNIAAPAMPPIAEPVDSLTIARGAGVTPACSLLRNTEAVITHHLVVTGETLDWRLALHNVDQILSEKSREANRPFPAELAPIACWLERFDYTSMAIYSILNYIAANGTVDLCPICDSEDKSHVEMMIPASVKLRASGRRFDVRV